jgi:hypothetical protein
MYEREIYRDFPHLYGGFQMLWTILAVVLVLWLLGFVGGVGGSLIHALLLVAGVIFILQILSGRRPSV